MFTKKRKRTCDSQQEEDVSILDDRPFKKQRVAPVASFTHQMYVQVLFSLSYLNTFLYRLAQMRANAKEVHRPSTQYIAFHNQNVVLSPVQQQSCESAFAPLQHATTRLQIPIPHKNDHASSVPQDDNDDENVSTQEEHDKLS